MNGHREISPRKLRYLVCAFSITFLWENFALRNPMSVLRRSPATTSQIHVTFAFNRDPINYRITAAADEYIVVGTVGIRTEGGDGGGGHGYQTMSDHRVVYWISVYRRKRIRYN